MLSPRDLPLLSCRTTAHTFRGFLNQCCLGAHTVCKGRPAICDQAYTSWLAPWRRLRGAIFHIRSLALLAPWIRKSFFGECACADVRKNAGREHWPPISQIYPTKFLSWAEEAKITPYIGGLSKETIQWPDKKSYPNGHWNKGHTTTTLMKFCGVVPAALRICGMIPCWAKAWKQQWWWTKPCTLCILQTFGWTRT